jgi:hypothetical protein
MTRKRRRKRKVVARLKLRELQVLVHRSQLKVSLAARKSSDQIFFCFEGVV